MKIKEKTSFKSLKKTSKNDIIFIVEKVFKMAVETSLSRLQNQVDKLQKENVKLRDLLAHQKENNKSLRDQIKYLEKTMETKIEKAIKEFTTKILEENEVLKKENEQLKRILNHDSNNTGIPTSKTPIGKEKRIPNSREKSNKSKGGQPGHTKNKLSKFEDDEITDTYIHDLENKKCSCGGHFEIISTRTKDEFDIQIRVMKIRHEFGTYECNCCHKKIVSPIPDNLKEENQYGIHAQALAISLLNEGSVSFHRVKELINGFTNNEMNMSEGYLAKLQKRCYEKLTNFDKELHKEILKQKVINWDDTVIDVNKKRACLRFYGTEKLAYYTAHEKKDKQGLDEDGILKYLSKDTVVVHDHNIVNYNEEYEFTNAECCVHLIRDLKELSENIPREWIEKLIHLLVTTNEKRKENINQSIMYFDQEVTDKVIEEYDKIIEEAKNINKKDFNSYYGNDEKTLIKRLIDYKENYLLWVLRFDVPFSNNLSERSLRSSKTKMKVSGQFSNISNASYYARIKSYVETCKRNGLNPHTALQLLLEDSPYTIEQIKTN